MSDEPDLSAAFYALGVLEGAERRAYQRILESDASALAEVAWWQDRLAPLALALPAEEPPAGDWAAIAERLGFATGGTRTMHEKDGVWVAYEPGVDIKFLQVDPISAARTALLRMRPGAEAREHPHDQAEHCVVLDGDVQLNEHRLTKGDLHIAPAGSEHSLIRTVNGALLLLRWEARAPQMPAYHS